MRIMPGAMLGVLGGGQLGRMFVMAAQQMGYRVTVLDPLSDSPAGRTADNFICADYADQSALEKLSGQCAAITTEFENIPANSLRKLAKSCVVSPDAYSVSIAQNRIAEKQFLGTNGFAIAPFAVIQQQDDFATQDAADLLPGILKVSQFGYDGKGQKSAADETELLAAYAQLNHPVCVLEKFMPLKSELSVVVARGGDGELKIFPVSENQHVNGILDISIVPARISQELAQQAQAIACKIAEKLNYQGVLCVEFFVLQNDELLINEIAPRPHNSGHYSINACITSQFEQQVRTLCGMPLGETAQHSAAVMVNLLGDLWQNGEPDWSLVLQNPLAKLHLYGKTEARPGRKMGHYTVLSTDIDTALQQAIVIKKQLEHH
ncbi:MAG: 5-(carboxyamino)imidazole ribonucleotide synthase [Nitrosomonas sp.]|uniref:5-(carboxyamino)imidazole ribonucleotide synthase n=1 Tax=Nitrosomonas sp. TaxID=42353 RepID=UPI0027365127|nr:5-(carboxyamino)imidazole ribonucleotide synthase [Nitrosomonas sp.]MDP3662729.1 5-(carboxyamino)imidazole ribonucleotide synthase [Nitrosomonas sp.]MDZ4106327.1 5-(carboxyamino)imidazole ribonucleotide synthase [Nitrosomonas sp.]